MKVQKLKRILKAFVKETLYIKKYYRTIDNFLINLYYENMNDYSFTVRRGK